MNADFSLKNWEKQIPTHMVIQAVFVDFSNKKVSVSERGEERLATAVPTRHTGRASQRSYLLSWRRTTLLLPEMIIHRE